jgi:ribosomal protein S18 acetylase RimI-like enzyme
LADSPDAFGTTFEEASALSFEDWQRQLEHLATFVATADHRVIGMARGVSHDDISDTAYLFSMWVAPEARRRGIATALIDTVVGWAIANGFRRLVLDVAESNAAAFALYSKKGFIPNGTLSTLPPPGQHVRECQLEIELRTSHTSS